MKELTFEKNRRLVKFCPCGKHNKDGKFAPFKGFENKGYCHSCGETFFSDECKTMEFQPIAPKQVNFHNPKLVDESMKDLDNNCFIKFMLKLFAPDEVVNAIDKYKIGSWNSWNGATVFWQIDQLNRIRHGKIILYDEHSGKKQRFNSVRNVLGLSDFNLNQCLFGLHLINEYRNNTIGIVESEKTAILLSIFKPQFLWLATGGLTEFKEEKLKAIKDYSIVAFPDKGKFKQWLEITKKTELKGFKISINEWLEQTAFPNETDLADVLIQNLRKK